MKDLLDGRIAIERRADNTIALINADGTREALTPEQTAEFAMALLRAAAVDPAKHAALMQFHSIAAAQNLAAGGGDPVPQGAEFERAAAADPPGQDDDRSMRPVSPSEQPLREGLRFEGNPQNPDNAQFRSGYQPGFVGPGRGHLGGLPDEDLTFRPSSRRGLTILDINDPGTPLATDIGDRGTQFQADAGAFGLTQTSTLFEAGFVGPGLLHLEPLRNDDYRFEEARPRDRAGIREDDIAPVLGELLPNPVADAPMISVADAPMISVGSGAFSAEEDSRIALTGLSAALVDADGSETLSAIRIAGVPAGGSFCDAAGLVRGANNGDGSWSFAPSDLAGLHFQPPLNLHGAFNLTFEATSREGASGETATAASSFTITVTAEADAPVVNAGSVNLNEDVLTPIGAGIAYGLADQDGSEAVTAVRITGFPAGSSFVMPPSGGAVITALAGGFVVTGSAADIRATLDGLAVRAPANSDNEIGLVVAVTSTDADGSTAAAANTLTLTVAAVADAPVVTGAAAGAEDAFIAVPIAVALADTDGSESLSSVVVSQVPSGALLQWQSTLPGTVTGNGSGSFTFTGSTAEIQALLQSLTIRPPANSDAGFSR
ncbi:MAG: hypothetical protein IOC90_15285, partial [Methylocystis sp.]|nr:hypothetical protein [Methylocystis sp.]